MAIAIVIAAAVILLRFKKVNPAWLVLGGAVLGWLAQLVLPIPASS